MKSSLKAKLLQHLFNKKNANEGFTLIELLVVIIIIGILAAIALPSFLNQTSKAKEAEAKTYISTINKSQQAYYTERQQFATVANLALGIQLASDNYTYAVNLANGAGGAADFAATAEAAASTKAGKLLKATSGMVVVYVDANGNSASPSLVCQRDSAVAGDTASPIVPTVAANVLTFNCPANYTQIK
jgi:type IV pilus assembly protein PilA